MATHPYFNWPLFGSDLRKTREVAKVGLREIAREHGIHHATWCRAEQGKPITVPHFLQICEWMGADPFQYQ